MSQEDKGVDLYDELKKTLDKSKDEDPGPSDQKPEEKIDAPKEEVIDENVEMSEEEISKLSPRAQKRFKKLADEVKRLAELPPKEEKTFPDDKKPDSHNFNNVEEFLNAVEDEPSRNLLNQFYKVIKGEISTTLSPIERANSEAKFNEEFAQYEKIEGLADYKNDLRKTFMTNPNQSLKALVGEVITDLSLNKVKPLETTPSSPSRDGKVDLDGLSKGDLYDRLESMRP